ncbi:MAG: hypothetical protein N2053_12990, partial [Chitinispirillaceae bacterium]|nr:hypothetical protein [Chitinispirillaceae bacterium]
MMPVLQISNYWSSSLPQYVYIDGVGLTQGTDYFASLDDNRNQLTIGFNRNITTNSVIFIDDNSLDAYYKTGPTKKMYWGIQNSGTSQYFWVKNTSGSYFGSPSAAQFYVNWKMTPTYSKDGEIWQMKSSVTNPYTLIDTTTGYNLIPMPGDYWDSWGSYNIVISGQYMRTTNNVTNNFTFAVEESSQVRVRLRINERVVSWGGQSYKIVTKWTIYPTGQFFRYDSIYQMSGTPSAIYIGNFFRDQTYSSFLTNEAKKRGAVIFSQSYPDFIVAWLSMKNASGYQSEPFDRDTITTRSSTNRVGIDFEQSSTAPSKWNSTSVEAVYYLDIQHPLMNTFSMDSISNGVQCIKFPNRRALSMISGTLDSTTAGDLNGDGFNETEGAYIIGASNNTVHFVLPAKRDTCRYYPAFRIKNYLATSRPQYVFVYSPTTDT